ncbi:hypothetical protein IWQ60_005637 [Tieghemiomyces parasiticus]|uniref:HAUS augmin-like complex subunit 6 N-terminal domain-containing protein n=1 Tax=Tieghemiomyces parasiticus TaxID=78921 RepID=A0A9W8DUF8_9FUNG|nr:hypothetical protein IWQ60_005637 [Tieghemiomyces parasiticus]
MDKQLDPRQLLLTNLHILGWHAPTLCTGPYVDVVIDTQVFRQGHSHHRAAEVVLKFLFDRLDPAASRETFGHCYPVAEPRQAREFRNGVFKWLETIRKETGVAEAHATTMDTARGLLLHPYLAFPSAFPVRRSYLDECRGPRFEALLAHLSRHVLAIALLNEHRWRAVALTEPGTLVTKIVASGRYGAAVEVPDTPGAFFNFVHQLAHGRTGTPTPDILANVESFLNERITAESQTFLDHSAIYANAQRQWQTAADLIAERHTERFAYLAERRRELREARRLVPAPITDHNVKSQGDPPTISRNLVADLIASDAIRFSDDTREQQAAFHEDVEVILDDWQGLDHRLAQLETHRMVVDAALQLHQRPAQLRAVDYPLVIPEPMANTWAYWLQEANITPYHASQLNLPAILHMATLASSACFFTAGFSASTEQSQIDSAAKMETTGASTSIQSARFANLPALAEPPTCHSLGLDTDHRKAKDDMEGEGTSINIGQLLASQNERKARLQSLRERLEGRRDHLLKNLTHHRETREAMQRPPSDSESLAGLAPPYTWEQFTAERADDVEEAHGRGVEFLLSVQHLDITSVPRP